MEKREKIGHWNRDARNYCQMNIGIQHSRSRRRGALILEVIAYLAIFVVVLGMATDAFYQSWSASGALRRDAEQISQSMQAGERWRADVRGASGEIEKTSANGREVIRIPQAQGEIIYSFADAELRRRPASGGKESVVLSKIKSSRMQIEREPYGLVCQWDLELEPNRARHGMLAPLFTFAAVAPTARNR